MGVVMNNTESTALSYSSMALLQTCEQQYVHRKVLKSKVDDENEDRTAFDVGSATHHCVEMCEWGKQPLTQKIVDEAIKEYPDAFGHKGLVHGMAIALIKLQELSGLVCVKAELMLTSSKFVGYIDLIAKYPNGDWYIIDLKTAASKPNDGKLAMLPLDRQLNLYASYAPQAAGALDLDIKKFQGCIYRVVVKSKAQQKATETYPTYVKRMAKACKAYDIVIPKEKLSVDAVVEMFEDAYVKSMSLREGEIPTKNLGACFNYFKTCVYFSKCHGHKAPHIVADTIVKTAVEYEDDLLDLEDL